MATLTQSNSMKITTPRRPLIQKRQMRELGSTLLVTGLGLLVLAIFLMPLGYMVASAFKLDTQLAAQNPPLWPATAATFKYQDKEYTLYNVPTDQGVKQYALVQGYREDSDVMDPAHPEKGVFNVKGRWRTWEAIYQFKPVLDNFKTANEQINFGRLYFNTFAIATLSTIGTLISCIAVAYGFARFRIPGKNILFIVLISTIVLPTQATIIPLYILFTKMGWTGTWLPLIVPAFFANAYDVFLLRQYIMTIPKELDEAAMIDGASPLRTLLSVILPQAVPAVTAVTLFHFFYAWNDYFNPLVYLVGKEDLYPLSVGLGKFVGTFSRFPGAAMASASIAIILPVIMFFLAQRQFMQGVVITGVEK